METSIRALFTMLKESLIKFIPSGGFSDTTLTERKGAVLAANLVELITSGLGRSISLPPPLGAGDEHFQNKYERMVLKDAQT